MLTRSSAGTTRWFAALFAALAATWLAGCGSEQAGATAGTTTASNLASPPSPPVPDNSTVTPRPKLRPGAKTKVLARAGDRSYDKTFDDLRFEMTVGEAFHRTMLTKQIEELAGQRIRIRGYILPSAQNRGIAQFVLVRDNQECCFGPGAALYDCILVEMQKGQTTEYSIRPVAVEGKFDIHEIVFDGKHLAIYHLDGESVR